jgi:hypothetical protein
MTDEEKALWEICGQPIESDDAKYRDEKGNLAHESCYLKEPQTTL